MIAISLRKIIFLSIFLRDTSLSSSCSTSKTCKPVLLPFIHNRLWWPWKPRVQIIQNWLFFCDVKRICSSNLQILQNLLLEDEGGIYIPAFRKTATTNAVKFAIKTDYQYFDYIVYLKILFPPTHSLIDKCIKAKRLVNALVSWHTLLGRNFWGRYDFVRKGVTHSSLCHLHKGLPNCLKHILRYLPL